MLSVDALLPAPPRTKARPTLRWTSQGLGRLRRLRHLRHLHPAMYEVYCPPVPVSTRREPDSTRR